MGSNFRIYQHQYYLLPLFNNADEQLVSALPQPLQPIRKNTKDSAEISQVAWLSISELRSKERPYYQQRFFLLHEIEQVIQTYLTKCFSTLRQNPLLKVQTLTSSTDSAFYERCPMPRRAKNKQRTKKYLQTIPLQQSSKLVIPLS